MKKRLFAAFLVLSVIMMAGCGSKEEPVQEVTEQSTAVEQPAEAEPVEEAGPSVEELEAQATEAIEKGDFDTALTLAKEAGSQDTAVETKIRGLVKDAYDKKIDDSTASNDYETALSLINEGNGKLGGNDLDEKLSDIPDAVLNNVNFEKIGSVDSNLWVIFIEKKGDDWYLVSNPDLSYKDASSKLEVVDIEKQDLDDGNKEYKITFRQTPVYTVSYPSNMGEPSWYYCLQDLTFFDYYSGQVLEIPDTSFDSGESSKTAEMDNLITWKGEEYPVVTHVKKDGSGENAKNLSAPSGMTETQFESSITFVYTITCPTEYDGLCAYLTKTSVLPSDAEENNKNSLFDSDGKAIEEKEKAEYMFRDKNAYGIVPTADTIYAMRIDDCLTDN